MSHDLDIPDRRLEYTFKFSRKSRRLKLAVQADGKLVVTAPRGVSREFVDGFVRKQMAWILAKQAQMRDLDDKIILKSSKQDFAASKAQVLQFVTARVSDLNRTYNFGFKKLGVRNQKTRWGSCSRRGNLNFNYKIMSLTPRLTDYIIVHELCHLKEMNHSPRFWQLVALAIPDYKDRRAELRHNRIILE